MIFLITLWIITLVLGYQYSMMRVGNERFILPQIFPNLTQKRQKTNIIKRIASFRFFTTPGWFIEKTILIEKINCLIKQSNVNINFEDYCRFKQFVLNIFVFIFWIIILFGEITWKKFIYLLCMGIFSYIFLDIWLRIKKEKQILLFQKDVPYFIDMVALTLETGMNIQQALVYITNNGRTRLSSLLKKQLKAINMGQSLEEVLSDVKQQVPVIEFENFVSSIIQAKKLGVSLAETLKIQSDLIRTQRRQKAEELGRTAAVKISIPLVFFIFPALLIIYIGPGILRLMNAAG